MYPSMNKKQKSLKGLTTKSNENIETNKELETPETLLLGIHSIGDMRSVTRDKLKRSIYDFISHSKEQEKDKVTSIKLKSLYVGNYKIDTSFNDHNNSSLSHLDFKEYMPANTLSKNNLSSLNSRFSVLYNDPGLSSCCSPSSDKLETENFQSKFRFITKDSSSSLNMLNQNMTSKVQLKSRNDAVKEDEKVKQKDIEIRKFRRSQERIKSNKEREIIRVHKHKKSESSLKLEDPSSLENCSTFEHIDLFKSNKFVPNLNKNSLQTKRVLLHKTKIKILPQTESNNSFKASESNNRSDNLYILPSKYDKLNRRS